MDTIVALRRQGAKPRSVFVYLVESPDTGCPPIGPTGIVTVEIGRGEALSDIDFRPLVGLVVMLCDVVGDDRRYRQLGSLVAAINPARLVMPVGEGDDYAVHVRQSGQTETYTL